MKLFKHSKFVVCAVSLALLVLVALAVLIFWWSYLGKAKSENLVEIKTIEGDVALMQDVYINGILYKHNYFANFKINGENVKTHIETQLGNGWGRQSSTWGIGGNYIYNYGDLTYGDWFLESWNVAFSEQKDAVLVSEEVIQESEQTGDSRVVKRTYQPNEFGLLVNFCENVQGESYRGKGLGIIADYTIEHGACNMLYSQTTVSHTIDNVYEEYVEDLYVHEVTTSYSDMINYSQLTANVDDETYVVLPTLVGAKGDNGIYRLNKEKSGDVFSNRYIIDNLTKEKAVAQLSENYEKVANIPMIHGDEDFGIPVAMLAHGDFLIVAKARSLDEYRNSTALDYGDEVQFSIHVFDTQSENWVDEFVIEETFAFEDMPCILYENDKYFTLGFGDNQNHNLWVFILENEKIVLKDTEKFQKFVADKNNPEENIPADIKDAYYDGEKFYVIEIISAGHSERYIKDETTINYNSINRIKVVEDGEILFIGAIESDVKADYPMYSDSYTIYGSQRVISNLEFVGKVAD